MGGRRDRNRTCNLRIWRPLLCQLSYPPLHREMIPHLPVLCNYERSTFRSRCRLAEDHAQRLVLEVGIERTQAGQALRQHDAVAVPAY
jgi:hypothetical protein